MLCCGVECAREYTEVECVGMVQSIFPPEFSNATGQEQLGTVKRCCTPSVGRHMKYLCQAPLPIQRAGRKGALAALLLLFLRMVHQPAHR